MKSSLSTLAAFAFSYCAACLPAHAADLVTVSEKAVLPVSAAKTWNTIRRFDGLHQWHPAIAATELKSGKADAKGAVRVLKTADGAAVTEELLGHDDKLMTYSYRMTDTPLPVADFKSTIKVTALPSGSSVEWTSSFKAKDGVSDGDAKKMVAGFHQAGLEKLKAILK